MSVDLSKLTLGQALERHPQLLDVMAQSPLFQQSAVSVVNNGSIITALERSPLTAMTTGIASGENGQHVGVYGYSETNVGVYGESKSDWAGYFKGKVWAVDLELSGADCAERFELAQDASAEPGSVMVIADNGRIELCHAPYDRRVAGIVSGAGAYKPGIVLDSGKVAGPRAPLALVGKTYCQVDASDAPIAVGTLLTTSSTPGHAMAATDQQRAFGAVIGKALAPWENGKGLIPVLVALQ